MKKVLIASFVGGIILFVWSFLAWTILPIHLHTFMYTPAQDTLLQVMAQKNLATGAYGLPMADNRNISWFDEKYKKESETIMKSYQGFPVATVFYKTEGYDMSGLTILKGFLLNLITAFLACFLLAPAFAVTNSFFGRWWITLAAGLLLNTTGPLIQYNWMGMPWNYTFDMVIDNFLNTAIVGLWFAYYFGRK